MKLKWTPSEGEFYAGDVFNRDSSVCAYNCADSGSFSATATIDPEMMKGLIGLSAAAPECDYVITANTGVVDVVASKFDKLNIRVEDLSVSLAEVSAKVKELAAAMSTATSSIKKIDRAAFKTLSPQYEVLK